MSTQAIAFQASQIAAGSTPLDLSGSFKIPKRPAQTKGQGPARKRSRTQDAAEESNSATRPLHNRARVLFLPILGGKALRRMAAHPKPEASERRGKAPEV